MEPKRQFNLRQLFTLVSAVCVGTALLREAIAMQGDPLNFMFFGAFAVWVGFWLDWSLSVKLALDFGLRFNRGQLR